MDNFGDKTKLKFDPRGGYKAIRVRIMLLKNYMPTKMFFFTELEADSYPPLPQVIHK